MDLQREISDATDRIENKKDSVEGQILELDKKIISFTRWAWVFVWAGLIITLVGLILFVFTNTETGFALNLLGDFMAGTVASIWSLAGLFFIYVAFLGQKQQLLNQQLEIMYSQLEVKYTRLELAGQKAEMKTQNETLKQQKFENTFFQLLTLFNSIVNSMDLRNAQSKQISTVGRDCFLVFYNRFVSNLTESVYGKGIYMSEPDLTQVTIEQSVESYNTLYLNERADLSHYFRTFYHVIKFIDNSNVENKKQYIAIARAQLSSYEQIILFYNCLHKNGNEKFKPLIDRYGLFKNIDDSLIVNQDHLDAYENSAYGKK